MPIYEYQCQYCGHQFEQLQKVTDAALKTCPKCSQPKLKKLISNTSFQLKGTGWYATDFKTKKTKKPESKGLAKEAPKEETSTSATAATTDKQDKGAAE